MKNQRKIEIKVGITVIIGILLLIWVLGWAKNLSLKSNESVLMIRFNSVAGLERGDAVTINGVRKGYVDEIILENNSVLVKTFIDPEVILKKDAKFSIMMLDLMGGKKIEVNPGNSEEIMLYSEIQQGEFAGDISTAMSALNSVQSDMVGLVEEIKTALLSINEFLGDKEFTSNIKSSVKSLKTVSNNLNQLLVENRQGIKQLIDSGNELSENANNLIQENREVFNKILIEIKDVSNNSNELIGKLNSMTDETQAGKNNLGKILYDEKLVDDLKETLIQVKEMTQLLIDQLKNEGINVDAHIF